MATTYEIPHVECPVCGYSTDDMRAAGKGCPSCAKREEQATLEESVGRTTVTVLDPDELEQEHGKYRALAQQASEIAARKRGR